MSDDDDRPIVFARVTEPDVNDPGLIHLVPASYTKRQLTRNHVIEVLKHQLARAEAGEIDELIGVAIKDGTPQVFYAHTNVIRLLGALSIARASFETTYLAGGYPGGELCDDD